MNLLLKPLAALALFGAFGAVDAGDQATVNGTQATGDRQHQHQKVTAKVGKIEDIDGDGVAAARAVSARGVTTGKVTVKRPAATSTAQNNPLYEPKDK